MKNVAEINDPVSLNSRIRELEKELDSLKRSGEILRKAEIAAGTGSWELHLDTGMMYGSEGAMILYGLPRHSFAYEAVKAIPLPEYRPMLDKAIEDLITEGKPYNVTFKIKNAATGRIIDIHSICEYDSERRKLVGSIQDITEQKRKEELTIRDSFDLSLILRITLDLLETVEKRKVLQIIISGAARLIGLDTGALYFIKDDELILEAAAPPLPDDFPDEFRRASLRNHDHIQKAVATKLPVLISDIYSEQLSDEEKVIIQNRNMQSLLYIPLLVMQKVTGVIILGSIGRKYEFSKREIDLCHTLSNIGSLSLENSLLIENLTIAKEKAEGSDRLKTAFLHNISHEIRTPLTAIVGFSTLLNEPDLTVEKRNEYTDIIISSNDRLLTIIDDIMRISHIESGQVKVNKTKTEINKLTQTLFSHYQPLAAKKKLGFSLDCGSQDDMITVTTDESILNQILSNLLDNAFNFTHDGYVILGCRLDGDFIEFTVKDTGIGIPEEEHKKIFERFYQATKPNLRLYSGTGLGLSIGLGYATLLDGTLSVKSSPGKGSVFTLRIPK